MDDDHNHIESTTEEFVQMHLFRIGKYKERGMTTKATTQIKSGEVPVTSIAFNHKHRTARRRLFNNINNDFSKHLFDERIDEVMHWVEMTDVYNKAPASNSGKHHADVEVDAYGGGVKINKKAAAVGEDGSNPTIHDREQEGQYNRRRFFK